MNSKISCSWSTRHPFSMVAISSNSIFFFLPSWHLISLLYLKSYLLALLFLQSFFFNFLAWGLSNTLGTCGISSFSKFIDSRLEDEDVVWNIHFFGLWSWIIPNHLSEFFKTFQQCSYGNVEPRNALYYCLALSSWKINKYIIISSFE